MHKPPYVTFTGNCANTRNGAQTRGLSFAEVNGSWSSVKTPGFKLMKDRSKLQWNPFSSTLESQRFEPGSCGSYPYVYLPDAFIGYIGQCFEKIDLNNASPFQRLNIAELKDKVRGKALDKLKGQTVNLAQAFAERKQTVDMLAKNVNRLATAALAIRRGNLRHASELFGIQKVAGKHLLKEIKPSPKNLSNHWLEFSFGWKPLVSDIYGCTEAVFRAYNVERPLKVVTRSEIDFSVKDVLNGTAGVSRRLVNSSGKGECRLVIEYVVDNEVISSLSSLGITNPLTLAWELTPWSFVVDWIIPIGNYIDRLDATAGLSFKRGSLSTKWEEQHFCRFVTPATKPTDYRVSGCAHSFRIESKTREILTGFPKIPSLVVKPHLGLSRTLSGISLLVQAFGRK